MKANRSTLFSLSLLCLVPSAVSFVQNACAAPKPVHVLQLRQNHVYLGKLRVLLTPQALRVDGLGKFRFTIISRSPKWQVTAFRPEDRISFTQSFDDFCDQGLFSNMVMPQRENTMQKGGAKFQLKVSGFPVQQIREPTKMLKYLKNTNYAAPQAATFFHSAYKVPTEGHIPIEFELIMGGKDWMTNLSEKGQRRAVLETEKISLDNVPNSEFDVPRGLAQAKSMTRIIVGDTEKMEKTGVGDLFHF
jgi:hypothetical protein